MIFSAPIWLWVGFNSFVLAMLALDLGVFHWAAHIASLKEALSWSIAWIMLALIFNVGLYMWRGSEPALQFLTGYLIEKSLSVDNIFVLVFASIIDKFYYLRLGLAVILTYVGVKMVLTDFYHISPALSLLVIALVLSIAIVASLLRVRRVSEPAEQHGQQETVVPLKKRSVSMQDSREHRRSSS